MRGMNPLHVILMSSLLAVLTAGSVLAQTDFSGEWTVVRSQDNTENPWVGDWFGLPLNAAGLARAESWDASILSLPEYQCRPHGWAYIYRGPTAMRISKEVDPYSREVIAYHPEWHQSTDSPVFLDARQQPADEAPHVWGGFSAAAWEGDILRIETTHLKEDYIRRNGAMVSDEATVTSWWIRRGDYLTWINIVHDPNYLSEPLIRSSEYRLNVNSLVPAHPCTSVYEGLEKGHVPHFLLDENPFLKEIRARYGVPAGTPTGGAETMYPEFQRKLRDSEFSNGDRRAQRTGQ
ncbi:MAG: hypothetical protein DMG11_20035 [Acidobacteria bacterium]|nr:MAG: hypothetical protein DMG11_20035 [Acidobacteriota bacterium]